MSPVVSIILPIHNQADHVHVVVAEYRAALADLSVRWEILLIENGSRDGSAASCDELAARHPEVRALHTARAGWGGAVRMGLAAARGEFLCYANSARTRGNDLRRVVDEGLRGPERVIKAVRRHRELIRVVGSWLYNLEARLLFGVLVPDVNGTPKLFHRRFAPLLALQRDDDLIDLEFCLICHRHGYPVLPLVIDRSERRGGASTMGWRSALRLYYGALRMRADTAQ